MSRRKRFKISDTEQRIKNVEVSASAFFIYIDTDLWEHKPPHLGRHRLCPHKRILHLYMQFNEIYFYTSTINGWQPLIKQFSFYPIILQSLEYLYDKKCIRVYGFVIMPNHIHLIWELKKYNGKETPAASFMKFTAHQFEKHLQQHAPDELKKYAVNWTARKFNFWKPKSDWFLLNNMNTIAQKLNYIHNNPLQEKWNMAKHPCDYVYSSAKFYEQSVNDFLFLEDYRNWM